MSQIESQGISPEYAIANAMMVPQLYFLNEAWANHPNYSAERALKTGSAQYCQAGSVLMLNHIIDKYPNLFQIIAILRGFGNDLSLSGRRITEKFTQSRYKWHEYFLGFGNDNIWYAVSPANHRINNQPSSSSSTSPMLTIFHAKSLDRILTSIVNNDGGRWPNATQITRALERYTTPIKYPTPYPHLQYFELSEQYESFGEINVIALPEMS